MRLHLTAFIALIFLLTSLLQIVIAERVAIAEADCSLAKEAQRIAESIRQKSYRRQVPCRVASKDDIKEHLTLALKEDRVSKQIAQEETVYKLLGILPYSYDYRAGVIRMYTAQIGGYYDTKKKIYSMSDTLPFYSQMPVAVHELTHAIQDQHYNLDKFMDHTLSSDEQMARAAVGEGDATAVMLDYLLSLNQHPSISSGGDIRSFQYQVVGGIMLSTYSISDTPPILTALAIFPYLSGLEFIASILRDGGYPKIDRAFKSPPKSTAEILHPQSWGKRVLAPIDPPSFSVNSMFPTLRSPLKCDDKPVYTDRYGEFFLSLYLGLWMPAVDAQQIAEGWDNDAVYVYPCEDNYHGLVWRIKLSTVENARRLRETLSANLNRLTQVDSKPATCSRPDSGGMSDGGNTTLGNRDSSTSPAATPEITLDKAPPFRTCTAENTHISLTQAGADLQLSIISPLN